MSLRCSIAWHVVFARFVFIAATRCPVGNYFDIIVHVINTWNYCEFFDNTLRPHGWRSRLEECQRPPFRQAVWVVWLGLRFWTGNVLQSQQTPSAHIHTHSLPTHTLRNHQLLNLKPRNGLPPTIHLDFTATSSLYLHFRLFFFRPHSFIATIPFLSLTASLIWP